MDTKKIKSITCGILFDKSFRIMDLWGTIVDETLYHNDFFSPEYFPGISSAYTIQGELKNDELGHSLILSNENMIYRHVIQKDFESEYKRFCERIEKYIVPSIIYDNKLIVRRLGVVFTYDMQQQEIERFTAKYFKPEVKGISDFRFSKKESTSSGGIIAGNSNFINKIITVGGIGKNQRGVSYDFQLHYLPAQECINDKIDKFLSNGIAAFKKDLGAEVE